MIELIKKISFYLCYVLSLCFLYNLYVFCNLKQNLFYLNQYKKLNQTIVVERQQKEHVKKTEFILHGVLYVNQERWMVWINDDTFTFDNKKNNNIEIMEITSKYIELKINEDIKKIDY